MPRYRSFSLQTDSDLPQPELCTALASDAARQPDVVIRKADLAHERPADIAESSLGWARDEQVCLAFPEAGQFLARRGSGLLFDPALGAEDEAIRHFLLGPMLGVILHQRGYLVLHASAVRIGDAAVAFLAEKGRGKSTLAAAFHAAGHTLISDDVVPVKLDVAGPRAYPGFPQCRIYVLGDGDAEETIALPAQQAFMSLVRHSFTLALLRATGHGRQPFSTSHRAVAPGDGEGAEAPASAVAAAGGGPDGGGRPCR